MDALFWYGMLNLFLPGDLRLIWLERPLIKYRDSLIVHRIDQLKQIYATATVFQHWGSIARAFHSYIFMFIVLLYEMILNTPDLTVAARVIENDQRFFKQILKTVNFTQLFLIYATVSIID